MEEKRNGCKILVRRSEGKRPLPKHGHRWEDNTEIDLREITWGVMGWILLPQDGDQERALSNTVMNLWFP
jgi:hypothetical protein